MLDDATRLRLQASEMDELRRPVMNTLLLTALVASGSWIIGVAIVHYAPPSLVISGPPLIILGTSVACLTLRPLSVSLRTSLFLIGLTAALTLGYLSSPARDWLYGLVLVAVAGGALSGPVASSAVAAALSMLAVACLHLASRPPTPLELLAPLGLLWATTLISSMASRSLYTTLRWALDSQSRAWQTADEVRARRGELRRTLDSLRITHRLLERTMHELEAARREAEEAREVKSHFVANISHEFRTPLNIIVGFAEMLCTSPETYGGVSWSPALREDIVAIWRNAEHLLKMVDDVLDLAQIEASRLPVLPEPVDLIRIIQDALATGAPLLRESSLELRVSLPTSLPLLHVDPTRIRQVVLNLVNNAIRFTERGFVEVGAFVSEAEVVVYVRDAGEGIPPDKLEAVFERFDQVDVTSRRSHGGLGLGLAISRHLIRLHGGRIWAESELGQGSTFFFTLPCTQEGSQPALPQLMRDQPESIPLSDEKGKVVALCQDPLVVRILARHLDKLGVVGAQSVGEAAAMVHDLHPAAVLVVGESPGALDLAQATLEAIDPLDVPTIVCDLPTERRAGSALGVSDFLIKPVTQKELSAAIRRLRSMPRRILVVDDDPDMLRLLCSMAQQEWKDAQVMDAPTGREAIQMASQLPDVVLLDLLMPGLSGVEVLDQLRANPVTAAIPVIVVTARAPAEEWATLPESEVRILRKRPLAAGEMVRVIEALGMSLPPHYPIRRGAPSGTREAPPA